MEYKDFSDFELLQECLQIVENNTVKELLKRFENRIKYDIIINKFYSVCEVAGILGLSDRTIWRKISTKELSYSKHSKCYIKGETLINYLDKRFVKGEV